MPHRIGPIKDLLQRHTHITGRARIEIALSTIDFSIDDHVGFTLLLRNDEGEYIGTINGVAVVHDPQAGALLPAPRFDRGLTAIGKLEVNIAPSDTDIDVRIIT